VLTDGVGSFDALGEDLARDGGAERVTLRLGTVHDRVIQRRDASRIATDRGIRRVNRLTGLGL